MFGKKVFAAMLATVLGASLFGANAAKAVINLNADDKSAAVATYATETLAMAVPNSDGYYRVVSSEDSVTSLNVEGMVGLGGSTNSVVTIRFDLRGLVFSTAVIGGDGGHLAVMDHTDINIRTGGEVGSNSVSFLATRQPNAARESVAILTIRNIGVKPNVPGSVTMTVRDTLGPDIVMRTYDGAIRTETALQEKATAKNAEATVEHRFVSFGGKAMATLGSFMVSTNTKLLDAEDGGLIDQNADNDVIDPTMGTVTIEGDFSFASRVWLEAEAADVATACTTPMGDQRTPDGDEMLDEVEVPPSAVLEAQDLCIEVPIGEMAMAIPETESYTVTTKYTTGTPDAAFPPSGAEHSLGQITRDGTTVHIPFLTTWKTTISGS